MAVKRADESGRLFVIEKDFENPFPEDILKGTVFDTGGRLREGKDDRKEKHESAQADK